MNKQKAGVIGALLLLVITLGLLALNVYVLVVAISALFATGHTVVAWLFIISVVANVAGKAINLGGKE